MQTKIESIIESIVDITIGYVIALVIQIIVFPLYGIHTSIATNMQIAMIFLIAGVLRKYFVRRFFNNRGKKWT